MTTCGTCAHCETSEGVTVVTGPQALVDMAGVCTLVGGYFNGKLVPVWLGCPWHEPIASAQGDGDPGSEAA